MNFFLRKKQFLLYLPIFLFLIFLLFCERDFSPLRLPELSLKAQFISCTEVRLQIAVMEVNASNVFEIRRDGKVIYSGSINGKDTTVWDSGLEPAHSYTYKARLLRNGKVVGISARLPVTTLNTTSHNYVWQIDTVGTFGSYLMDVFALSEDDVWAVGKIDTGVYPPFNAVHWNGSEWELKRIPFTGWCSAVEFPTIKSVFAFSDNDIWFARGGSLVHYDGNSYYNDCEMNSILAGSINKIWGTNSNNIFVVGGSGTIVHYQSGTWQKMESGTNLTLTDIWGVAENDIYAVGADMSSLDHVVLHYDGNRWEKLPSDQHRKVGVWGLAPYYLFFVGDGVYRYNGQEYQLIDWPVTFPKIFSQAIRGNSPNNIFVVGHFGMILHFNGKNWNPYPQFLNFAGTLLTSVAVINNSIFAVGDGPDQRGRIYRGRRIE